MDGERRLQFFVGGLRNRTLLRCKADANDLRLVWVTGREIRRQHRDLLGTSVWRSVLGSTTFSEADLDDAAAREIAGVTGLSLHQAGDWLRVADRLCGFMPRVVAALDAGRIDLARVRTVAAETDGLTGAQCRKVEAVVLEKLPVPLDGTGPVGPWDARSPRAFTALVRRAVAKVRTDTEEQVRADLRERTGTWLRIDPANPAIATWTITGPTDQLIQLEEIVSGAVQGMTGEELAGRTRAMAKVDLIDNAIRGGGTCGAGTGGVSREVGVVLNADTLFDDGPAAGDPGQVRGTGHPVAATATTARVMAGEAFTRGAGTCVLLADSEGYLTWMVRLGPAPEGGWTRAELIAATRAAVERQRQPRHQTGSYLPTVEIAETVRARDPVCTFPGCGVPARRCDLDHTVPHPRGPTAVHNLSPRSRRCHRFKTAALWRCRTRRNGSGQVVAHEWTSPLGTRQVVAVQVLPGYAPGEAYAREVGAV